MICAVILAAGESSRMGSHKLLLPFGNVTVIERVVRQVMQSRIQQIVVVLGHNAERVASVLKNYSGIRLAVNPRYKEGMLSSVRFGLGEVSLDAKAFLVVLGDQPTILSETIDEMVRLFHRVDKGIIVPVYEGKRGHPILISAAYRKEIMTEYDDTGLRGIMKAHPEDVGEVRVTTPGVLTDMDTMEDYRRALAELDDEEQA